MKQSKILTALGLSSLDIQNMLMNGLTMPEIAKKYNITYIQLKEEVKDIKNVSFAFDKLYTEESLNEDELLAYYKYEQKNKAYYEHT